MRRILLIAVSCLAAACDRPTGEPPAVPASALERAAATGGARAPQDGVLRVDNHLTPALS